MVNNNNGYRFYPEAEAFISLSKIHNYGKNFRFKQICKLI